MEVIPALLDQDIVVLEKQLDSLSPFYHRFQIDIADNTFVPNTTTSLESWIPVCQKHMDKTFDFHLMVNDYEKYMATLQENIHTIKIGVVFIHTLLKPDLQTLFGKFPQLTIGLVINPQERVEEVSKDIDLQNVEHIQIMGINPGFQGSPFIPESLQLIEQLRGQDYRAKIYIDGSVNDKTIPQIKALKHQPDFLCIGSYLVKAEDTKKRVEELQQLL